MVARSTHSHRSCVHRGKRYLNSRRDISFMMSLYEGKQGQDSTHLWGGTGSKTVGKFFCVDEMYPMFHRGENGLTAFSGMNQKRKMFAVRNTLAPDLFSMFPRNDGLRTRKRWSLNPSAKCSYERPPRGTVCGTMRGMCGADAGCLAID